MATATLRKVGGSIMLAVPRKILSTVDLQEGSKVAISVDRGRLIVTPQRRKYKLSELLRGCRRSDLTPKKADREWLGAPPVGKEEI